MFCGHHTAPAEPTTQTFRLSDDSPAERWFLAYSVYRSLLFPAFYYLYLIFLSPKGI